LLFKFEFLDGFNENAYFWKTVDPELYEEDWKTGV